MTAAQKAALEAALEAAKDMMLRELGVANTAPIIDQISEALDEPEPEELGLGSSIMLISSHTAKVALDLQDLPEHIKEQGKVIADLGFSIEEQRYNLQRIENENMQTILSAKQDGKPVYSNDKARQIALEELLLSDIDYQDRKKELGGDLRNFKDAELHFEYLNNKLKTTLALSRLLGAR